MNQHHAPTMRPIPMVRFTKMHGIGNDYIYVNGFTETVADHASLSRAIPDRHTGVGGAYHEDAGGAEAGGAYVLNRDVGVAQNWGGAKHLTASAAEGDDQFGKSVAVEGDTAVVGALGEDAGPVLVHHPVDRSE